MVATTHTPFDALGHYWLADMLLADGRITREQYDSALRVFRADSTVPFMIVIERLNLATQHLIADYVAKKYNAPCISINLSDVDSNFVKSKIPERKAKSKCVITLGLDGDVVDVAIADPRDYPAEQIAADLNMPVRMYVAPRADILSALETVWSPALEIHNAEQFFHDLVVTAIKRRTSDIHLESGKHNAKVRLRIDGVLYHHEYIPIEVTKGIVQHIKILSGCDNHQYRLPQDGMFRKVIGSRDYAFRVSCTPCYFGENIVIRIQADQKNVKTLEELGLDAADIARLEELGSLNNGVVICTGPTNSGKSTLLNSLVQKISSPEIKILSAEEPVEFPNSDFSQMQINEKIGLTFASALRSMLRQDPDVILVGEIRDLETAEITTRAALTGHLCLSTLHTNSALAAVPRLVDIGIDPYLVAATLRGVIAVRLVKRLCPHCRRPDPLGESVMGRYKLDNIPFTHSEVGCTHCLRGYKGLVGLYEVFQLFLAGESEEIRQKNVEVERIINRFKDPQNPASVNDLLNVMLARGGRTLRQHGLISVDAGVTSLSEVLSVS